MIYVVYKKTSDSKYYLVKINDDDSVTAIAELADLSTYFVPRLARILTDSDDNVYAIKQINDDVAVPYVYTLYKWNSSGVLQLTKVLSADSETLGCISPDGYLYTMKNLGDEIYKRNLSDLEIVETISLTSGHRYCYLCFDSDGYLYTYDREYPTEDAFIKWKIGVGVVEVHNQNMSVTSGWEDWALLGNNIACNALGSALAGVFAIALNSDYIGWNMDDIPNYETCGVASDLTYWYVLGKNTANDKLIIEKYNADKTLISTITVSEDYISDTETRYYAAITAYPFISPPTVTTQEVSEIYV